RGVSVRDQENNLLISVLNALHENLGSELAWVRTQNELRTHFVGLEVCGDISPADVPNVSIAHASGVLPESFGVISDSMINSGLKSFTTLGGAGYLRPSFQSGKQSGAVVMLRTTEGPLALFSLIE